MIYLCSQIKLILRNSLSENVQFEERMTCKIKRFETYLAYLTDCLQVLIQECLALRLTSLTPVSKKLQPF